MLAGTWSGLAGFKLREITPTFIKLGWQSQGPLGEWHVHHTWWTLRPLALRLQRSLIRIA